MTEHIISIAAKISEYLVEPLLIRPFRPIFCFGSIVADFHDQKNRLIATLERVENDVQCDRDNALVIYHTVEEWVKKMNTSMQEVQRLENELVQNKSCFRYSWCPNWTFHHSFSRQVSQMAATMKTLCDRGDSFSSVSHPPALQQDIIGSSSCASFVHSQSSKPAFDQIMEALKGDVINLISLYGRAGAGKTTMAQLVGNEAGKLLYGGAGAGKTTTAQPVGKEAKKLFDHVIMVPVAQYPLVSSQQGFIAEFLGLQFDQLKTEQGRAAKLQLRLKNGEKILIIFDDVQKEFNLGAIIGILSSDSACKILLTTRHQTVAEIHVHTQKDIELGALSEEEAWTLLKSTADVGNEVRTNGVVKDALEDCNGLPKAIVAMGKVLKGKGVHEWGETLRQHNAAKFKFIDSVEEGVKNLSLRQDRVNIKINMAKERGEKIYTDVEKWLKDVERVMNDVEQFKKELNKNRWCFDELGVATRVEVLATCVKDLQEQGNFDQVSHPAPLEPGMRLLSSEDFLFSEAAKSAFDQILKALKTDGVNMIGLYGMGGIGKTTLASQVHNEVIRQNALAVMVTVSQKPDVGNMQDKIADFLNLEFKKKTLGEKAIELENRLKDKKILIILDDVWKQFDLGSIGITLAVCKDCKVLMTTRGRDVCNDMNCQSVIQLDLFSEDESEKLFRKKAGLANEFELDDVGKQIVAECKCLPIALQTVGAALKKKGKDEWVEALEKIKDANLVDIIGVDNDEKNVYKCLRLSYDYLNDQPQGSEAQFLLLLCSLFPDDYEIEVEDLARYAFGMKLFGKVKSVEDARRKVRVAIRFLRGSCLLLDAGDEDYVKLHDVVRDVLLWIGATEHQETNTFTVRDDDHLKDLIRKKSFQNCKALSFTSDVIPKFSKYSELEFPNLEIVLIFLKDDKESVLLGDGLFEHMKHLKVLDVRGMGSVLLVLVIFQSLHCLEHLRTLTLRNCRCVNSAVLRDLGRLRILSLGWIIDCGVEVVSGLKKLRLLDLSGFWAERTRLTSDVTERLVKLEELYGYEWDEEGTSSKLSELKLPSNLVALSLVVEDVRCLPRDFCFPKLESYDIHIGKNIDNQLACTRKVRRLVLRNIGEDVVMKTCEKLLPTVQQFRLSKCDDLYSLPSLSLQELERLEVEGCKKMEWVLKVGNVGSSSVQILSLKILLLSRLNELTHIWEGTTRLLSLCNLTYMEIAYCPKLICIFPSPSLAASLQQLEFLIIRCCDNLEDILGRGGSDDDFSCCCFTNLREVKVTDCDKVKAIFPLVKSTCRAHPQSHLPNLQKIVLKWNYLLKHIWEGPTRLFSLCNLTKVEIYDCPNLICIFPSLPSLAASLQQLEILEIELCRNLEDVFSRRGGSDDDDFSCCCFTNLRVLRVSGCAKVKTIFPLVKSTSRDHRCRLPKLQEIVVEDNSLLEHIFGHQTQAEEGVDCPSLQELEVTRCPNIFTTHLVATQLQPPSSKSYRDIYSMSNTQIVEQRLQQRHDDLPQSTIMCFSFLERVELRDCNQLKQVFTTSTVTSLHLLEVLIVEGCNELEQVIGKVGDGKEEPVSFENLKTLRVSHCGKLTTIFPISIALPQLEELELKSNAELEQVSDWDCTWQCPFLKHICLEDCPKLCSEFAACILNQSTTEAVKKNKLAPIQGDHDDLVTSTSTHLVATQHDEWPQSTIICFSLLHELELKDCNKLKQVFTTSTVNSLHRLEKLIVEGCNELEQVVHKVGDGKEEPTIGVCFEKLETLRVSHCGKLKTIFPISIALPKLEKLELKRNAELEYVFGASDWDCTWQCPFLKDLFLEDCPKLCSEFAACILNPSTTEVVKNIQRDYDYDNEDDDNEDDVKSMQRGPAHNICFADLCQIKIIGFQKLKHLFTAKVATNVPNLERLIVRRCDELEQVIKCEDGKKEGENGATTEMIGFEKLQVLHVSNCKKLKTVFSTFIPLPKLDTLLLHSNAVLESLFGRSDCDFSSHWTELYVLSVTGCPKLCTETIAIIKSQLSTRKGFGVINLSNIQGVEELIQIPRQEGDDDDDDDDDGEQFLKVEELGNLKRIWSGPTQDISFSCLVALRVIGCDRLKQLFTTTMATSLQKLELLWVERCHDLQQIIEEEEERNEENNTQSVQQIEFSNLNTLRLIDLPNLISFCPTFPCNLVFTNLTEERVKLKGCPKPITDFFSKQSYQGKEYEYDSVGEDDEDDGKFEDDIYEPYCTHKYAWALFGVRSED